MEGEGGRGSAPTWHIPRGLLETNARIACNTWATCEPRAELFDQPLSRSQTLSPGIMALSDNIGSHSATTAALNAGIETLIAAKDTLEIIPAKAVFESVIAILTLVRVRVPFCPLARVHFLVTRSGRDDRRRCLCGTGQVLH